MKSVFSFVFVIVLGLTVQGQQQTHPHHNRIDEITSAKQVANLLVEIDSNYSKFGINDSMKFLWENCQFMADSLNIQPWTRADLDGNGYTDLLVMGEWYSDPDVLCLMDKGHNHYQVVRLTRYSFQDCTFPLVKTIDNTPVILYYTPIGGMRFEKGPHPVSTDTLVFKFGDFIEWNPSPVAHRIEKITYSTTGCFGTCPVFELTINSDHSATYHAEMYNKKTGQFKTTIKDKDYEQLTGLLNYARFDRLKDNYAVNWTDDQSCTLTITYDGGKTKTINDYGLLGSFTLNRIYTLLFDLRESQDWKP